jgi:serine/threonine protein kinase
MPQQPSCYCQPGDKKLQLKIVGQIRVEDNMNSQIAMVQPLDGDGVELHLCESTLPSHMVAKFYDPLYYNFQENRPDPFFNCDAAFAHETSAYHHLQPLQGTVVPRFHGSYTVDIPLRRDSPESRPVRAILYEYIPGFSLREIEVDGLTRQRRQEIMAGIIDVDCRMLQLGVNNLDLHPRNVIVTSGPKSRETSVCLIDFDWCKCRARSEAGHLQQPILEPLSDQKVLNRWDDPDFSETMIDFGHLVDWPWSHWLKHDYIGRRTKESHTP